MTFPVPFCLECQHKGHLGMVILPVLYWHYSRQNCRAGGSGRSPSTTEAHAVEPAMRSLPTARKKASSDFHRGTYLSQGYLKPSLFVIRSRHPSLSFVFVLFAICQKDPLRDLYRWGLMGTDRTQWTMHSCRLFAHVASCEMPQWPPFRSFTFLDRFSLLGT